MIKEHKKVAVNELQTIFSDYTSVIVFHYKGLNVVDINFLRAELQKNNAKMKVIKNTLASIALKESKKESMVDLFKGPSAIAWSNDPVSVAKVLHDFAKKNNNLILIGGIYDSKKLEGEDVKTLANLPSLDEIRSKLVAIIQTPATNIASLLQKPASMLATVLNQYSKNKCNSQIT